MAMPKSSVPPGARTTTGIKKNKNTITIPAVKSFVCLFPHCPKRFTRSEHLSRHQKNHGKGEYICARCAIVFKRRDCLERHVQRHGEKDRLAGGDGRGKLNTRKRLWKDDEGNTVHARRPADLEDRAKRRSLGSWAAETSHSPPPQLDSRGSVPSRASIAQDDLPAPASQPGFPGSQYDGPAGLYGSTGLDAMGFGNALNITMPTSPTLPTTTYAQAAPIYRQTQSPLDLDEFPFPTCQTHLSAAPSPLPDSFSQTPPSASPDPTLYNPVDSRAYFNCTPLDAISSSAFHGTAETSVRPYPYSHPTPNMTRHSPSNSLCSTLSLYSPRERPGPASSPSKFEGPDRLHSQWTEPSFQFQPQRQRQQQVTPTSMTFPSSLLERNAQSTPISAPFPSTSPFSLRTNSYSSSTHAFTPSLTRQTSPDSDTRSLFSTYSSPSLRSPTLSRFRAMEDVNHYSQAHGPFRRETNHNGVTGVALKMEMETGLHRRVACGRDRDIEAERARERDDFIVFQTALEDALRTELAPCTL